MEINIRGDKITVTQAIQDYAKDKLSRINKYIGDSDNVRASVLINVKGHDQKVEVTIPLKTVILRAEETRDDLYAAIDVVVDKLERQIRKNKTKLNKRREVAQEFAYIPEDEEEYVDDNMIVKRKMVSAKPMSEDEAILQMELLDHDFFMFKNEDEDCFSVLYRRKDGNYGIICSK